MNIAVIGGGAAGFFAALNIAEKHPHHRVTILEAGNTPLQKVRISGGGRCNLTHACFEPRQLASHYPRGNKALLSLFSRFQPSDTMRWFEERGLPLKTEEDGRVFPLSDTSEDVITLFLREARRHGVTLKTRQRIQSIHKQADGDFLVTTASEEDIFNAVILATGYSPPGWQLAKGLGHTLVPPVPSLFPFKVEAPVLKDLPGVALPHVTGKLKVGNTKALEAQGALLITHAGVSGPVIYRLSAQGARLLAEADYRADLILDLLPGWKEQALHTEIDTLIHQAWTKKKLANTFFSGIPRRFWRNLLEVSGANLDAQADHLPKKAINRLIENLKRLSLPITGKSPSKEEFVSCGGIKLDEVDFRRMESRICPGLYFAGEILDIDGLTGGFNFQSCWSAAWVISENEFPTNPGY